VKYHSTKIDQSQLEGNFLFQRKNFFMPYSKGNGKMKINSENSLNMKGLR
jgi:hypothetical protein